jgi:transketolase
VPGDVALMDTLPGVHVHAPSTSTEVDTILRTTVAGDGLHYVRVVGQTNRSSYTGPGFHVVRRGAGATVIALGPVLDDVLEAVEGRDVTVLYASTVRPFDSLGLRAVLGTPDVVLVEPWLAGTSAHVVGETLRDLPHRLLALGVARDELRRYGTPAEHIAAHGLDAAGIRRSLDGFLVPAA